MSLFKKFERSKLSMNGIILKKNELHDETNISLQTCIAHTSTHVASLCTIACSKPLRGVQIERCCIASEDRPV